MSGAQVPPAPARSVRSILCPNCGGAVELRGMQHTRSAVCIQCCTIIDLSTPELKIIQQFEERLRVQPLIPMGSRGKLHGTLLEVIGFQVRTIFVDGIAYSWHEYLLFNPYKGFRYLTTYNGHWNDVITLRQLPFFTTSGGRKAAKYLTTTYKHFQHATATTTFVMGEFPWAVKVGDTADCDDFVAPPEMLSMELSEGEVNWSLGNYIEGDAIWKAFQIPGQPPRKIGVFANQPSPYTGRIRQIWGTFLKLALAWAVLLAAFTFIRSNKVVYEGDYSYAQSNPGEHSFVTPVFEIPGRTSNVQVELRTDLANNWAYFNLALLREDGTIGFDFGRQISYYSGTDSDGVWTEGRAKDSVTLDRVPAGRYYLRIEPEMDPEASRNAASGMSMRYGVRVTRDVPDAWLLFLAFPLLLIPPIWVSIRAAGFEGQRWQESDYAPASSSGDGDDD